MGHSDVRHVSRIGQIFVTRAAPFRDDGRPMRCGGERCRALYQPQPQPPKRRSSDSNSMSQPRVPGISASTFIVIDHQTMLVEFRMINRDHRSSESPPARVFFFFKRQTQQSRGHGELLCSIQWVCRVRRWGLLEEHNRAPRDQREFECLADIYQGCR